MYDGPFVETQGTTMTPETPAPTQQTPNTGAVSTVGNDISVVGIAVGVLVGVLVLIVIGIIVIVTVVCCKKRGKGQWTPETHSEYSNCTLF